MMDELILLQPGPQLALETRGRRQIPNVVAAPPGDRERRIYRKLLGDHPGWKERKPPAGGYNCAGMVWASRRTSVEASEGVQLIWEDDGLRTLRSRERLDVGDLACYHVARGDRFRDFLHVGVVIVAGSEILQSDAEDPILVLSKFNSTFGEVVHPLHDVPFDFPHEVVFWTDRP